MAFSPDDIAAAYALNVVPRLRIKSSTQLGLYRDRPDREYRVWVVKVKPPSPQLDLFRDEGIRV